jgi:hypothetical protein
MEEKKPIYTVPTPYRNSGNVVLLDDDDNSGENLLSYDQIHPVHEKHY